MTRPRPDLRLAVSRGLRDGPSTSVPQPKRRVLIHSNYSPLQYDGGIERVVTQLWEVCAAAGYAVTCICGDSRNSQTPLRHVTVLGRRILCKLAGAPLLSLGNWHLVRHAHAADLVIFQEPYPFLWPAMLWLRLTSRVPVIVLMHADPAAPAPVSKAYAALRRQVFADARCVATSPNLGQRVFASRYAACEVIPLGVPETGPAPAAPTPDAGLPTRYVLYIGRLAPYKGLDVLLDAVEATPHVQYIVAGSGPLVGDIHQRLTASKLTNLVFLANYVGEGHKERLIAGAEFVVFPSSSTNEAFGLVQLEAMRAGKPLVNTRLDTGVNYVAPDRVCALTVPPRDARALAQAIDTLWHDSTLVRELGDGARARYLDCFTLDRFMARWRNCMDEAMDG